MNKQPADCKALIDKLKACNEKELLEELKSIKSWNCGKVIAIFMNEFNETKMILLFFSVNFIIGLMF